MADIKYEGVKYHQIEIDDLKNYYGEPYKVTDKIYIYQPSIEDIILYGEKEMWKTLTPFITNPTTYRVQLWDAGQDWNKMSDFQYFCGMYKTIEGKWSEIFFKDIDFKNFAPYNVEINGESNLTLYNKEQDIEINEQTYMTMAKYLQILFNAFPRVERAKGKETKRWMIEEDRLKQLADKDKPYRSQLQQLISFCVNHPGFKYRKDELRKVNFAEFMDSVKRLQVYESTRALMGGMYSGFMDTSKIDKENFNFMRSVEEDPSKSIQPNKPNAQIEKIDVGSNAKSNAAKERLQQIQKTI